MDDSHDNLRLARVPPRVIAIGTSTGGPKALEKILPLLPADLPVGILIVQHMPPGFIGPFVARLDTLCQVIIREAANNDLIESGVVYIAPAGLHMTIYRRTASQVNIHLSRSPEDTLHRPSVDVMMLSVAEVFRACSMGIIMTGMGTDGVLGMEAITRAGGTTLGQDESSSTAYGMPRACARRGVLQQVVPLLQIPEQILQATRYRRRLATVP
jgi:two-component system chemotaxis response regulator CheB